jgi:hypothetical protein
VYYPDPNHPARLLPAYYVEVNLGRGPDRAQRAFASVISAADGAKLWKRSLAAREKFSYRVYADESGLCMPWDGPEGTSATLSASALPDHRAPRRHRGPQQRRLERRVCDGRLRHGLAHQLALLLRRAPLSVLDGSRQRPAHLPAHQQRGAAARRHSARVHR